MSFNCKLDNIGHLLNNVYLYIEVPTFFQNDILIWILYENHCLNSYMSGVSPPLIIF